MMRFGRGATNAVSNKRDRHQQSSLLLLAAWTLGFVLAGCGSHGRTSNEGNSVQPGNGASSGVKITPEVSKEAKEIFSSQCATCHGSQGRGDGPAAARLKPKPTNFTDPGWQKSVTDEQIEQVIVYGGAAVGKSPAMPANANLQSDPAVVAALREMIRQMGGKPPAK